MLCPNFVEIERLSPWRCPRTAGTKDNGNPVALKMWRVMMHLYHPLCTFMIMYNDEEDDEEDDEDDDGDGDGVDVM